MDASNPVLTQFEKEHALVSEILTNIGDIKSRKTSAASSMFVSLSIPSFHTPRQNYVRSFLFQ